MDEHNTSDEKTTTIRKMYLDKRANVIRDSLSVKDGSIRSLIDEIQSDSFNATKDELLFSNCLKWMQDHLHLDAHITKLAADFDVSVRKIQRLFSFFAKKTYTTILLEMRMEQAKDYLAEFKRSIGEVAYLVGVKDHAYFTYLFRKHFGVTPSQYRLSLMQTEA